MAWWTAELTKPIKLVKIQVHANQNALQKGAFVRFKAETKMKHDDEWQVCRNEHALHKGWDQHDVVCDTLHHATYIRLSVAGGFDLSLDEVKVMGIPLIGKTYHFPF